MNDFSKVRPSHTQRAAFVYIRQSSPAQVEYNRESTARQYALVEKACALGWAKEQVIVIDQDLGLSGSGSVKRSGFAIVRQKLKRDEASQAGIFGPVDYTHPATPELLDDAVVRDGLADHGIEPW